MNSELIGRVLGIFTRVRISANLAGMVDDIISSNTQTLHLWVNANFGTYFGRSDKKKLMFEIEVTLDQTNKSNNQPCYMQILYIQTVADRVRWKFFLQDLKTPLCVYIGTSYEWCLLKSASDVERRTVIFIYLILL